LYRQFALYYVIGDERDIVRLRTNYRLEDVYGVSPTKVRKVPQDSCQLPGVKDLLNVRNFPSLSP
jgi:hypothetical protein